MRSLGAVSAVWAAGPGVEGLAEPLAVLEGKGCRTGSEDGFIVPFALSSSLARGGPGLRLDGRILVRSARRGMLRRPFGHRRRGRMVCPVGITPAVDVLDDFAEIESGVAKIGDPC